jgi:FeS assembly SUF system regulator
MLRLTKLTDYAIVVLTYFAQAPEGSEAQVLTARGLSEASRLPLPTVSKVLKSLSRAGLLMSHRGVAGGYSLARPPEAISVADVIAAIEGPISLTECSARAPGLCELEGTCPSRSNWRRINEAVRGALEKLSIVDMTTPMPPSTMWPSHRDELVSITRKADGVR